MSKAQQNLIASLREEVEEKCAIIGRLQAEVAELKKKRYPLLELADAYYTVSEHLTRESRRLADVSKFTEEAASAICEQNMREANEREKRAAPGAGLARTKDGA